MARRVVLLVGAGSTVADAGSLPVKRRPPLDKGFFRSAVSAREDVASQNSIRTIQRYVKRHYGSDLLDPDTDSLEDVLARVYTDVYHHSLKDEAAHAFRTLVFLFNRRLALTTNAIEPNRRSRLYRIICKQLRDGVQPEDIAIVTFNYDLQIEQTLAALQSTERWKRQGPLFAFPGSYGLDIPAENVSRPPEGADRFEVEAALEAKVAILKLHGSLNWYSVHHSTRPSVKAMLRPTRRLWVTPRRTIHPQMTLSLGRTEYTLPLVVPPVIHKASILHERLKPLWGQAEGLLANADHVIIFGYSCPATDYESANLIERSMRGRSARLTIVDPNPDVMTRYVKMIRPRRCEYYPDAADFV